MELVIVRESKYTYESGSDCPCSAGGIRSGRARDNDLHFDIQGGMTLSHTGAHSTQVDSGRYVSSCDTFRRSYKNTAWSPHLKHTILNAEDEVSSCHVYASLCSCKLERYTQSNYTMCDIRRNITCD